MLTCFREAYRRLGELPKCSTEKSEYDAKAGAIELRIRGRSVVYGGQFGYNFGYLVRTIIYIFSCED